MYMYNYIYCTYNNTQCFYASPRTCIVNHIQAETTRSPSPSLWSVSLLLLPARLALLVVQSPSLVLTSMTGWYSQQRWRPGLPRVSSLYSSIQERNGVQSATTLVISQLAPCLDAHEKLKIFHSLSITSIFGPTYEVVNVGKNNN
jgi:hypothetical protein